MHLITLVKMVPDLNEVKFDIEKGRLDRASAGVEINPFDLNALEAAFQLKEKTGANITAVSMGPPKVMDAFKSVYARGVDRAILLTDKKFGGADTLATSYTLSLAIKKLQPFDLIFSGEKTTDGDTGQVGPEVAEMLGVRIYPYVSELEFNGEDFTLSFDLDDVYFKCRVGTPALISVTKDLNVPRLLTLKDRIASRKKEVEVWDAEKLGGMTGKFGLNGSPTRVKKIVVPKEEGRKGCIFGLDEGTREVAEVLKKFVVG